MIAESNEVQDEAYWRGKPFSWALPRVNVYVPADKRPRVVLNRYPHNIIGAGVVAFGRCWGVRWKVDQRTAATGVIPHAWWIRASYITTGRPWVTTDELDRPQTAKLATLVRQGVEPGWVARAREILR